MALKPTGRAPGRPRNTEKPVDITLKVRPGIAAYLAELGERYHWGKGHTEIARFLLMREIAKYQDRDAGGG